jgi:hypothetical protein
MMMIQEPNLSKKSLSIQCQLAIAKAKGNDKVNLHEIDSLEFWFLSIRQKTKT